MSMVCLSLLFTNGCTKQEPCVPIVKIVKPERVSIEPAVVEQCLYSTTLENVKCVMKNYVNMKTERDQLKTAYEEVTE